MVVADGAVDVGYLVVPDDGEGEIDEGVATGGVVEVDKLSVGLVVESYAVEGVGEETVGDGVEDSGVGVVVDGEEEGYDAVASMQGGAEVVGLHGGL